MLFTRQGIPISALEISVWRKAPEELKATFDPNDYQRDCVPNELRLMLCGHLARHVGALTQ